MPEGHTIHRLARDLAADLSAGPVAASSPQGRFDDGARRIDGASLERAEAWGKHLFCWWSTGEILHVHLGLIGKFRPTPVGDAPGDTIRLRLIGGLHAWHLTGPQTCAVITEDDRNAVVEKLGPDPLRRGTRRRDQFVERFTASSRQVGVTLLDQQVIAGIGNVYRAELLFLLGVHPTRPAHAVEPSTAGALWDETVDQLRRGVSWNRIVTVSSDDIGRRVTRRISGDDALYAYHRSELPCRRCDTPIEDREIGGRSIWFCPTCQPE